ncbi:MAG: hypothetical protein KA149_04185 [Chitinophagales bacterium]|nr:hypothetical protein [Chitinophagales bacterium]
MIKLSVTSIVVIVLFNFSSCTHKTNQNNSTSTAAKPQGVHAAFYNSNGSKIALSTDKGKLYVTNDTFGVLGEANAHEGRANSCFFSLNDKYIITGGKDEVLNVWQAADMTLFKAYKFNLHAYTSVYGYNTLAACGLGGRVVLYDVPTNKKLDIVLDKKSAYHLYYIKPDSLLVVSAGLTGYEISATTGAIVHKYVGQTGQTYCIMPSNSKSFVVTASADSLVRVFDRFSQQLVYKSSRLDGQVFVASFNPNDKNVAASTSSGSIYILDSTLTKVLLKIPAFKGRINTIHYSPDGLKILAGSEGGGAKIFSTAHGELLHEFKY